MRKSDRQGERTNRVKPGAVLRVLGLGALLWRERRMLLFALVCSIVGPAAAMVVPLAIKLVVDEVIGQQRSELLLPIALAAALGLLVQAAAAYGGAHAAAIGSQRLVTRLRQRLQQHTLRLPVRFFDSHQSGALVSRVITDTEQVQGLLGPGMLQVLSGILSALLAFAVLWSINGQLTVTLTLALLAVLLCLTRGFGRLHRCFSATAELQSQLAGRLSQVLAGIMVVKTCSAERRETHRFARDTHRVLRTSIDASRFVSRMIATITLSTGAVGLVLLVVGGRAVTAGAMTLGDLALFVVLAGLLSTPVVQAAAIGSELGRGVAALIRVAEVLTLPAEDARQLRTLPAPRLRTSVEFDGVSYAYEPGRPVLRDVSFAVLPGSVTAVTGPNGSGKSTLLRLLMGVDAPSRGRILVGGVSLEELRLAEYRRMLGVVLQENLLFDGTIRENIHYGRPAASPDEFRSAARLAHCDEFVERLPEGYETAVGERGVRLSGGQRQRIAIARALLADPPILLLDEAASGLDSESDGLLQQALLALCGGRTTLVITHRLSTIRKADQILVLRSGAIAERGTHEELIRRQGRYARFAFGDVFAEGRHAGN